MGTALLDDFSHLSNHLVRWKNRNKLGGKLILPIIICE